MTPQPVDQFDTYPGEYDTRSTPRPAKCPHWGIEHSDGMEWVCSRPAPFPRTPSEDTELEELGNQDIDPKVFAAWGNTMDTASMEQYIKEQREEAAAQAREDSMVEIVEELHRQFIGKTKSQILDIICECQINPAKWLKSLRTGGEPR